MSDIYEYQDAQLEFPNEPAGESEWDFASGESESESETDLEADLAWELLGITTEDELDDFLGKLARGVFRSTKKFFRSPIGRTLGGVLKRVAKTALPAVGGALGSLVACRDRTAIGSRLGSFAGGLLEAGEAEMMGPDDAQYEAARRYVQFARGAIRNAARTPRKVPPRAAARSAAISAARMYAPSLLRDRRQRPTPKPPAPTTAPPGRARRRPRRRPPARYPFEPWADVALGDQYAGAGADLPGDGEGRASGRWVRRADRVILLGV